MQEYQLFLSILFSLWMYPIYIMNLGSSSTSRKRALAVADPGKKLVSLVRNFWIIHPACTLVASYCLTEAISGWHKNSAFITAFLVVTAFSCGLASGLIASLPAYILVKEWKKKKDQKSKV
ncbi:hypothetical protein LCM19_10095 [Qipengyuania flava]|nr:hypothetical protein [Qipengyuania flava]